MERSDNDNDEATHFSMFIGGEWREARRGQTFLSLDPSTTTPWASFPNASEEDVDDAVRCAQAAFEHPHWSLLTATQRGALLLRLAELIERDAESLAQLESRDNGKLLRETRGQLRYLPAFFRYNAGLADKLEGETLPLDKQDMFGYTLRVPLGVVAAIIPWNSPLYLAALKLAPALAAGNTLVIKPSEHASASLVGLMALVNEAGFPPGVVNLITGIGATAGAALTRHPLVRRVAFTGGTAAAREVILGSTNNLARLSLELGGKSPNVVFADADLDSAVNGIVAGIFAASGQSCVAGSRVLVQAPIFEEVKRRLVERAARVRIGAPGDDTTEMGPIATEQQLEVVERMVGQALEEGAELLHGGARASLERGWYYQPTILDCRHGGRSILEEEVFGPVLALLSFEDEEQAASLANDTRYGLAAGVWTRDLARAHRMVRDIRAGIVWVNTYRAVSAMAPIGGFGHSGYGREGGIDGVRDYTEPKTVWINLSTDPMSDPFTMR